MEYLNKIINFFKTEEVAEDTLKVERNGFEAVIITANDKLITKFGNFKNYKTLYRTLIRKYNEYVANEIIEKLKNICSDCDIIYKSGTIKIKYENSYINIDRENNIRAYIEKKHFKKFLHIQNKLFETGILNAWRMGCKSWKTTTRRSKRN